MACACVRVGGGVSASVGVQSIDGDMTSADVYLELSGEE